MAVVLVRGRGDEHPRAATGPPAATATATATAAPGLPRARVARTFRAVSHRPNAIARVGDELWVTSATRPLVRLDALTGRPRDRDSRLGPGGKAISARGSAVWVANHRTGELIKVAAAAPHRLLARVPVPGRPIDVAADRHGGVWAAVRAVASPDSPATVLHYDAHGRELAQAAFSAGVTAILLTPDWLWVAEQVPLLMRVGLRSGRELVGAKLILPAKSLAYGRGCVWAGVPDDNALARVCPHKSAVLATAGTRPERLTYSRGRLYVSSRLDQTLVIIDPRTMKPAQKPLAMPFNPFAVTSDRRHVWVTSLAEDAVTRVDLQ